jgi:dehydrogenase/reductase SDR family member 7B
MKSFYQNKIVWITGASSGIGEEMAYILSKIGATLILTSENNQELEKVSRRCRENTAHVYSYVLDQSESEHVDNMVSLITATHKTIDVLILNAGISQRDLAGATNIQVHDRIMQINFRSHVQIAKKVLPLMLIQVQGNIGVTSSISGKFGFHLRSSYAASKHALHGYFESLGMEYRKDNVFVTLVCPGRVKTDISFHALHGDGVKHGKMDEGQSVGISVHQCALKYLKAVSKRRREKLIGGKELMMVYFKRYCPRLFYRIAGKIKPM